MRKRCSHCGKEQESTEFFKCKSRKDNLQSWCKDCASQGRREWRKNNPERHKQHRQKNRERHPENIRNKNRKALYGIQLKDYEYMLELQNGLCAICGQPEVIKIRGKVIPLSIDHDHKTRKFRGLLCMTCNRLLYYVENYINLFPKCIQYLKDRGE